jgi:hypothetical protein
MHVPQNLRRDLPYNSNILFFGMYPKEWKHTQERYLNINDFAAVFTIAKIWKDPDAQKLVS